MVVGVPKELKDQETRVALTPAGVKSLVDLGHAVLIENNAGALSAFSNEEYVAAGASIYEHSAKLWADSQMVLKVKEPVEAEYANFRPDLTLFTYLHLAPLPGLTERLLRDKVTGIAYETVTGINKSLPLLTPMSEVAGRMSIQVGASYLEKGKGGRGLLLGGVPGVPPAKVCILGGGIVGTNAAKMALGMGADVTIVDLSLDRLRDLDDIFNGRVKTLASSAYNVSKAVEQSELVIGAVLIPGKSAPRILTAAMVKRMLPGSVIVDVAIDQGGCIETARPTSHTNPSYVVDGVVHYCVTNMPAAVPNTSTLALTNATFPFVAMLANLGPIPAIKHSTGLAEGLNTFQGSLACEGVAQSQGKEWKSALELVA
ncbi:L-alanine dehydrogenase [Granulicella rosea]|uniref:Alanine dehydrogenase n=1 Tax=Granulicella rosea TaxID=474952 RepID=A0A239MKC7_9BACT|nr:alanine dehydrogenase [Granulicella rosea]SNT43105.1 L-alanine dehydrogenase [Granulicella rosea]